MSDLHTLLKKLTVTATQTFSYIYYEKETGKINKVSSRNNIEDGFEIFEILSADVEPILKGERKTEEFVIFYDASSKQIQLKEVSYKDRSFSTMSMSYQLPVVESGSGYDVVLIQDIVNQCWTLYINDSTKRFLKNAGYERNEILYFSVTSKGDPNILINSLEFTIESMLDTALCIPFKFEQECTSGHVSIYTAKHFDNYAHEVIQ